MPRLYGWSWDRRFTPSAKKSSAVCWHSWDLLLLRTVACPNGVILVRPEHCCFQWIHFFKLLVNCVYLFCQLPWKLGPLYQPACSIQGGMQEASAWLGTHGVSCGFHMELSSAARLPCLQPSGRAGWHEASSGQKAVNKIVSKSPLFRSVLMSLAFICALLTADFLSRWFCGLPVPVRLFCFSSCLSMGIQSRCCFLVAWGHGNVLIWVPHIRVSDAETVFWKHCESLSSQPRCPANRMILRFVQMLLLFGFLTIK